MRTILAAFSVLALTGVAFAQSWSGFPNLTPVPNDNTVGTSLHLLAKLTPAGQAVTLATTDLDHVLGIVQQSAGTSGLAGIAQSGQGLCIFDGPTTAGDYVQPSNTAAGMCHDVGTTWPLGGTVVGRALTTQTAGGLYSIFIFPAEIHGTNIVSIPPIAHEWIDSFNDRGIAHQSQPSVADIAGIGSSASHPATDFDAAGAAAAVLATSVQKAANGSDFASASQTLTNLGGVTLAQSIAAAPVQRVAGVPPVSGNVPLASGNLSDGSALVKTVNGIAATSNSLTLPLYNQASEVNGVPVTPRPNINFVSGGAITVSASDNGTDTTGITITGTGGTVTREQTPVVPSWLTATVGTPTVTPTITLAPAPGQASHQVIGTCGTATSFTPCSLALGDLPTGYAYSNLSGIPSIWNQTIEEAGAPLTQRANFNFAPGAGIVLTPTDNGTDTTTLTITATVPSVNYQVLEVNGTAETGRTKLNLVPGNYITMAATDNGTDTSTVTISGTGGTVTSLQTPVVPNWLTATVSNPTTTPQITLATATLGSHQVLGTCGTMTALGPCTLLPSDLPPSTVGQPAYSQSFTSAQSVLLTHNFSTNAVITQCFDGNNVLINPASIVVTDNNDVTVNFLARQTGRCVVNGQVGPSGASATAFNLVTSGTSVGNSLVIGAGSTLAPGGGTVTANDYTGTLPAAALPAPTTAAMGGVMAKSCPQGIGSINTDGTASCVGNGSSVSSIALNGGTAQTGAVNLSAVASLSVNGGTAQTGAVSLSAVTQISINGGTAQSGPLSINADVPDTYKVGSTGITQYHLVAGDSTASEIIRYPYTASYCNAFGVAQSSVAIGGNVLVRTTGMLTVLADMAIPVGDLVTCSTKTSGAITDTGQSVQAKVLNNVTILGQVETASTGANTNAVVRWFPAGTFGSAVPHSFGATFTNAGNAISSGGVTYLTVPYACVVNGWNINADAGSSVSFDVWKTHAGSAAPTATNSMVGASYPSLTTGSAAQSSSVTTWSTNLIVNDQIGIQLRGASGSPKSATLQVTCQ